MLTVVIMQKETNTGGKGEVKGILEDIMPWDNRQNLSSFYSLGIKIKVNFYSRTIFLRCADVNELC